MPTSAVRITDPSGISWHGRTLEEITMDAVRLSLEDHQGNQTRAARALGISTGKMKIIALSLSNGLVALSGALMSQYQGFADINMGRGSIVIGLAAIILGEALGAALLGKRLNFYGRMAFTILGGVVYYLVVVVVLWLKLNSNDLKLITAVIVALFLALPYLREKRKSSFRHSRKEGQSHA